MNNYDYLKKDSPHDNETVVSESQQIVCENCIDNRHINIFSFFISIFKKNNFDLKVKPINTLIMLLAACSLVLLLFILSSFIDKIFIIPIMFIIAVAFIPLLLSTFFKEINFSGKLSFLSCWLSVFIGFVVNILLQVLLSGIITRFVYKKYAESFVFPIIWTIVSFFTIMLICKLAKCENKSDFLRLSANYICGYFISFVSIKLFSSFFVMTEISINLGNASQSYFTPVIINDSVGLQTSINQAFKYWCRDFILQPIMFFSIGVIFADVISTSANEKTLLTKSKSIYFLVMLATILVMMYYSNTNIVYVNVVLKAVSIVVSIILNIKTVNSVINKELI